VQAPWVCQLQHGVDRVLVEMFLQIRVISATWLDIGLAIALTRVVMAKGKVVAKGVGAKAAARELRISSSRSLLILVVPGMNHSRGVSCVA